MQLAALAVIVVLGGCCVGLILQRQRSYTELQERFVRAVAAVAEFQKLQPELITCLRRIESDRYALRKVVLQVEAKLVELNEEISPSISAAAETQIAGIEKLRDHIDIGPHLGVLGFTHRHTTTATRNHSRKHPGKPANASAARPSCY